MLRPTHNNAIAPTGIYSESCIPLDRKQSIPLEEEDLGMACLRLELMR